MTSKARSSDLLDRLRAYADVVILDTPPALLTAEMTELSKLVDAVVVIVRQGFVTQRALRTLARQTRTWDADLVGAVVTDAPAADRSGTRSGRR